MMMKQFALTDILCYDDEAIWGEKPFFDMMMKLFQRTDILCYDDEAVWENRCS